MKQHHCFNAYSPPSSSPSSSSSSAHHSSHVRIIIHVNSPSPFVTYLIFNSIMIYELLTTIFSYIFNLSTPLLLTFHHSLSKISTQGHYQSFKATPCRVCPWRWSYTSQRRRPPPTHYPL